MDRELFKIFTLTKKTSIIYTSLFVICSFLLLLTYSSINGIFENIDKEIKNQFSNRDIAIEIENNDEFKKIEDLLKDGNLKISYIYKSYGSIRTEIENYGILRLDGKPSEFILEKIKSCDLNVETYIIAPKYLSFGNKKILMDDYVNTEISLYFGESVYTGTLIGLYDNEEDSGNILYTNLQSYNSFIESNKFADSGITLHIVSDNYDETFSVINFLKNYGVESYLYDSNGLSELKIYNNFANIIKKTFIMIILFIMVIILLNVSLIIEKEKESIALLKSLGYIETKIIAMIYKNIFCMVTKGYFIGILLLIIFKYCFLEITIISLSTFILIKAENLIFMYVFIFLLSLLLVLLYSLKIKKISIIKLIKDRNE